MLTLDSVSPSHARAIPSFLGGLRFRLILLVLLALVPALGLVIHSAQEQRRFAETEVLQQALHYVRTLAETEEVLVKSTRQFLGLLAQDPRVRAVDPNVCPGYLAQLLQQNPRYTNLGVVARDGENICRAIPGKTPAGEPPNFYHRVMETRDFAASDFTIGQASGKAALVFGYPIFDQAGQVQSVVYAGLDLTALNEVASQSRLPAGATSLTLDRNGTILARYPNPEAWVGKTISDAPIAKAIQGRPKEGTLSAAGLEGVPRLYAFTQLESIPGQNVYAIVGLRASEAFAQVDLLFAQNLLALGIVSVLALGAAWIGGEWFLLRQMNALLAATRRLEDGDLTARAARASGSREMVQLSQAFNTMAAALEQRETARKEAEENVRRWSVALEGLMNALAEAIGRSQHVAQVAESTLSRTLDALGLHAGAVLTRRGESFLLAAQSGFSEAAVLELEQLSRSREASNHLAFLVASGTVQQCDSGLLPEPDPRRETGPETWVTVPLVSRGRNLGVMCLACGRRPSLQAHEQRVLAAIGQQIGVAIENLELREQVQSVATLKERERLGRELHDGLAQVLGYLAMRAEVAREHLKGGQLDQAAAQLQEMRSAVLEAYQGLRESILGLRVTLSPQGGLISALAEYATKFGRQAGIQVALESNGFSCFALSPEAEVQLLRILQEALANVHKHSGARRVWIRFVSQRDLAVVSVQDDGAGFDPRLVKQAGGSGFGLETMRERAEAVGGSLDIQSAPGQGATITITLPAQQKGK